MNGMEATPERDEIIDFIRNSSRGVMKGYSGIINPTLPESGATKNAQTHCIPS
jgi:hypothetical protein